jgi:hypothetical protein
MCNHKSEDCWEFSCFAQHAIHDTNYDLDSVTQLLTVYPPAAYPSWFLYLKKQKVMVKGIEAVVRHSILILHLRWGER